MTVKRITMDEVNTKIHQMKRALSVKTNIELAHKLGLSRHSISNWQRRGAIPEKILLKFSQMTGQSIEEADSGNIYVAEEHKYPTYGSRRYEPLIDYYPDIYASAGHGATNQETPPKQSTFSEFLTGALRINNVSHLDIIKIQGDSMEPDFNSGEYIIIERGKTVMDVKNGDTVVVNIQGEIYIKKIEKIPLENTILLHSSNHMYASMRITKDQIDTVDLIGVVRGSLRPK